MSAAAEESSSGGGVLWTESGVSAASGEPFVALCWGAQTGQCTPDEARAVAMSILAAAEAAESDAAVVKLLRGIGVEDESVAGFVVDLRKVRSES